MPCNNQSSRQPDQFRNKAQTIIGREAALVNVQFTTCTGGIEEDFITILHVELPSTAFMSKSTTLQKAKGAQSKNVEFVGYSDMNGRPDSLQVVGQKIGSKQYLYVGHFWSGGVSILDVTEPTTPNVIGFLPSPDANTWNIKVQVADNILAVPSELNFFLPQLTRPT